MAVGGLSPVDFAAIADPDDEDDEAIIFDDGDDAVIANPLFPEFAEFRAFEGLSDGPWIVERGETLAQEA